MSQFLDLDPEVVAAGGRSTAATSTQWGEWASRVENRLREAGSEAQEAVVTAALEEHLSAWNTRMKGMASNADALGGNAVAASNVMVNADGAGTTTLHGTAARTHGTTTLLSRPITA